MRADRISANIPVLRRNLPEVTPEEKSSFPPPGLSRRVFLARSGGSAAVALFLSQLSLFAEEPVVISFEENFNSALTSYKKDENVYSTAKTQLLEQAKQSPAEFLTWYESKTKADSKDPAYAFVLEELGNKTVREFGTYISDDFIKLELAKEKIASPDGDQIAVRKSQQISKVLSAYAKLVEKNPTTKEIIQSSLQLCDFAIFPNFQTFRRADFACVQKFKTKQVVADDLGNQIISLYDASLKGVKALHEANPANVDKTIKSYINEIPWDSEGYDDRPDLQDKIVDTLSKNYFGIKREAADLEGLEMMLGKVTGGTSFTVGSCNSGWSPYIVFNLIQRNPEYFEAVALKCAELIKTNKEEEKDPIGVGSLLLKFFNRENLLKLNQQFRFTSNNSNGIPPVPVPEIPTDAEIPEHERPSAALFPPVPIQTKKSVVDLSEKRVGMPIVEAIAEKIKTEKISVEEKKAATGIIERYIDDRSWLNFNSHLPDLVKAPALHELLAKSVDGRLQTEADPYTTEMLYMTRGKIKSGTCGYDLPKLFKILEDSTSLQPIRGLAFLALSDMGTSDKEMTNRTFYSKLQKALEMKKEWDKTYITEKTPKEEEEKIKEKLKKLDYWKEINDLAESSNLSKIQKLVMSCVMVIYSGSGHSMKLMLHRKFPPPVNRVTFRVNGKEEVIEAPFGKSGRENEKRIDELKKTKGVTLLKEEVIRSQENIDDSKALFRMNHNAFMFLAYFSAICTKDPTDLHSVVSPEQKEIKKVIIGLLEDRFKYEVFNRSIYVGFDKLGEKAGALMEVYGNNTENLKETRTVGGGMFGIGYQTEVSEGINWQDYMAVKEKALSGILFKHNKEAKDSYDAYRSLFEDMKESAEEWAIRKVVKEKPNQRVFGTQLVFDDYFNHPIDSYEHRAVVQEAKKTRTFEDEMSKAHKDFEVIKAMFAKGYMNTARHRKMQEQRELLARVGKGYFDTSMLQDPYKYLKDIYKIDVSSLGQNTHRDGLISDQLFSERYASNFSRVYADDLIGAINS